MRLKFWQWSFFLFIRKVKNKQKALNSITCIILSQSLASKKLKNIDIYFPSLTSESTVGFQSISV